MTQGNSFALSVSNWSAWAPGLDSQTAWRSWSAGVSEPGGSQEPDVSFVKPIIRRRLSRLSRMAIHVAWQCVPEEGEVFCVFCSRYGEYQRAYEIFKGMARGEPASPNTFSLSVHNATASIFSILREDRTHSTSLAASNVTLEAGFLAARGLLCDNPAAKVLLVYYDEPLPDIYADHTEEIEEGAAIALLLSGPQSDDPGEKLLRLSWEASINGQEGRRPIRGEHPAFQLARLLTSTADATEAVDDGRLFWSWSCHAA